MKGFIRSRVYLLENVLLLYIGRWFMISTRRTFVFITPSEFECDVKSHRLKRVTYLTAICLRAYPSEYVFFFYFSSSTSLFFLFLTITRRLAFSSRHRVIYDAISTSASGRVPLDTRVYYYSIICMWSMFLEFFPFEFVLRFLSSIIIVLCQ